jgi:sialic acid synthase SpsE
LQNTRSTAFSQGFGHRLFTVTVEKTGGVMADGVAPRRRSVEDLTVSSAEIERGKKFRRSVVVSKAVESGHVLRIGDLGFKRPGTGIRPDEVRYVVGRRLKRAVQPDHELEWSDLD